MSMPPMLTLPIAITLLPPNAPSTVDTNAIFNHFCYHLDMRLKPYNIQISWTNTPDQAVVVLHLFLDPGNQFLRWLVPFAAPAVADVRGDVRTPTAQYPVAARGSTNFGLFGGESSYMLRVAAERAANTLAQTLVKLPIAPPAPALP